MKGRLTLPQRIAFGLGSAGTGTFATVPGLLLLFYMTDTLGIPAGLAGIGAFVPKIWDLLLDPVVGVLSDRTRSPQGRRRPWMLAGALLLPPLFFLMFAAPPLFSTTARFGWVVGTYVLAATAYAIYSVPYVAMPAEMGIDDEEVTRLFSWRVAFLAVGILLAGALAPLLVLAGGSSAPGYRLMAAVIALVLLGTLLACWWGTRHTPFARDVAPRKLHPVHELAAVFRNRPFVLLLTAWFLQIVGAGCVLAVVPYYATYVLGGDEGTVTLLFLALVLPAMVTMPLWVWVERRIGRKAGLGLSLLVFALGCFALGMVGDTSTGMAAGIVAGAGVGWAGSQLFPYAMLPDVERAEAAASGEPREGVMTGLWMSADKAGLALGALIAGQVLAVCGFVEGGEGVSMQPPLAIRGIIATVSMIPAAFFAASLFVLRFYQTPVVVVPAKPASPAPPPPDPPRTPPPDVQPGA